MIDVTVNVNLQGLQQFKRQLARLSRGGRANADSGGADPIGDAFTRWAGRYRSFVERRFIALSRGGSDAAGMHWAPLKPSTIEAKLRKANKSRLDPIRKTLQLGKGRIRTSKAATYRAEILRRDKVRAYKRLAKARKASLHRSTPNRQKAVADALRGVERVKRRLVTARKIAAKRRQSILTGRGKVEKARARFTSIMSGRTAILIDTGKLQEALSPTMVGAPGALTQAIPYGVRVGYGGPARHPGGVATTADIARFHQTGAGNLPARRIIVRPDQACVAGMQRDMRGAIRLVAEQTKT